MTLDQLETKCDELGYRLIGRDPYHSDMWHLAIWADESCSVTVGHFRTLATLDDYVSNHESPYQYN